MRRQFRLYLLVLSFVLGITAWAPADERHRMSLTWIQPPDGDGRITFVFDINDRGEIVGAYNAAPEGRNVGRYGFLRSADGTFTRINFPDSFRTHADGINAPGEIVGWYARVMGEFHGYLRTTDGEFTKIDFPGAVGTKAFGINARGDIVGTYCPAEPPGCSLRTSIGRGFLLREGEFTTIDVPGALATGPGAINDRGQSWGYTSIPRASNISFC